MTKGFSIFKDTTTEIPSPYSASAPVRTAMTPEETEANYAKVPYSTKRYKMNTKHVERPRRGHDM